MNAIEKYMNNKKFIEMNNAINKLAKLLIKLKERNETIGLVTHTDADGQTSRAILELTLERIGLDYDAMFNTLSPQAFERVARDFKDRFVIFADLGSGQKSLILKYFKPNQVAILDHHIPELGVNNIPLELNPHKWGFDGGSEISGAGMSYLLARQFKFYDLSQFAIVGAVGDMMNNFGKLVGLNRLIVEDGIHAGVLKVDKRPLLFGAETRPLYTSLFYLREPQLFESQDESKAFLEENGFYENGSYRRSYNDLTYKEKNLLTALLIKKYIRKAPPILKPFLHSLLVGEGYTLTSFPRKTSMRDASEFATLLNATNRQRQAIIGVKTMKNQEYYKEAVKLQSKNRRQLRNTIQKALNEIEERKSESDVLVTYNEINLAEPHLTGTLIQMMLDKLVPRYDKPVMGFVMLDNMTIKLSMREPKILYLLGIDLAKAVRNSAVKVGGQGGGHAPACGGFVKIDAFNKFIKYLEHELKKQLNNKVVYNMF